MANSPQEVLVECRQHDVKLVALHVTDSLGKWHQQIIPVSRFTEEAFEDGFAWSLPQLAGRRGEVADVLLIPQPATAFIQPFAETPTLSILCSMHEPLTREELPNDPRSIAIKAEKFAKESGVADEVLLALGIEFFLLDQPTRPPKRGASLRKLHDAHRDLDFEMDRAGARRFEGWLDDDFRSQIMQALLECGVDVAAHRQADQDRCKSRLELGECGLVQAADNVMITKHVVKQLARRADKLATFMPLPQAGRLPAFMPTQLALVLSGNCALSGSGYAGLSEAGLHAIGGILRHAPGLTALTSSTTNSYVRFGASEGGCLPRLQLAYSQTDLRAAVRVPAYRAGKHKCIEFQLADALCNPYLTFAALTMAAIDGIQNKLHPGAALDPNPYGTESRSLEPDALIPATLTSALSALEQDGEFLMRGDVLPADFLQAWIEHKRLVDVETLRYQPHPHEVAAYFDA